MKEISKPSGISEGGEYLFCLCKNIRTAMPKRSASRSAHSNSGGKFKKISFSVGLIFSLYRLFLCMMSELATLFALITFTAQPIGCRNPFV